MTISIIIHVNTEVLTTGQVIASGNKKSTSSGIDPVVVNKLIIVKQHNKSVDWCI